MKLENRIAVVTGGGGHVGRATSLRLAEEGAIVIVNDVAFDKASKVSREIQEEGNKAVAVQFDVTKRDQVQEAIDGIVEENRSIDILVNVAGGPRNGLVTELNEDDWDYAVDLNLKGSFNCIQAVARHMIRQRFGKIVNTSSTSKNGVPWFSHIGQSNYAAANAGLTGLTRALAFELAPFNININCVIPGPIQTPKSKANFKKLELDPQVKVSPLRLIPLGRLGTPDDVAKAILFLVSDDASYITGTFLNVSGGL